MPTRLKVLLPIALGILAIAPRAPAQNAFVAIEDGRPRVVKEIRHGVPEMLVDGKLQDASGLQYGFVKAPFYPPGLVSLPRFIVKTHHLNLNMRNSAGSVNYEMRVLGAAKSDVTRRNCFFVLELTGWKDSGFLYSQLPVLEAGKEVEFELNFKLQVPLEEGRYKLHLFSDGVELLHSKMPADYLAVQKEKTDDFANGRRTEFDAVPAHIVRAVYPADLKADGLVGRVRVKCGIDAMGQVTSAEVAETNDPAFAEPALTAVRQWKFDPAVKDRHLVESTEVVSVVIKPPQPKH